jgi:MATE family multidrug resistance protein
MTYIRHYFRNYNKPGGMKEVLVMALPMIISTACDGVMTFTDRLFLARLGSEHMNAAMGGGVTMQMLMFFFIGLTGYSTALVAQYFGAGQKQNSSIAAFQAMIVTCLAWPVIILCEPLINTFFHIMKLSENQMALQEQYIHILALGSIFSMMRYTIGCYFTGIGKTRIVMGATILAMAVNVLLDYILIFGKMGFPAMGISGAAIATVSGGFCAMLVLIVVYLRRDNRREFLVTRSFRFNWPIMKNLLYYGYPAGLEMFLNFLAFSVMVAIFHSGGDVAATAATIMFNWDLVSFIPLLGIEIAVTSLVGRYMGAGSPDVAHQTAISAIKIGMFYSIVVLALFIFVPQWLVRIFSPSTPSLVFEEAVPVAMHMIRIAALYVLAQSVMVATVGALRGSGDTHFTMIASVSANWLLIPMLYVTISIMGLSIVKSWLIMVIFYLFFCVILVRRFRSGKWKTKFVLHGQA